MRDVDACRAAADALAEAVQRAARLASHAESRTVLLSHAAEFLVDDENFSDEEAKQTVVDEPPAPFPWTTTLPEDDNAEAAAPPQDADTSTDVDPSCAYDLFKLSLKRLFDSLDHDGDGVISNREFIAATKFVVAPSAPDDGEPHTVAANPELHEWCERCGFDLSALGFDDLDRNGDGSISRSEFFAALSHDLKLCKIYDRLAQAYRQEQAADTKIADEDQAGIPALPVEFVVRYIGQRAPLERELAGLCRSDPLRLLREFSQGRSNTRSYTAWDTSTSSNMKNTAQEVTRNDSEADLFIQEVKERPRVRNLSSPSFRTLALVSFFGEHQKSGANLEPSPHIHTTTEPAQELRKVAHRRRATMPPVSHIPTEVSQIGVHDFLGLFFCRHIEEPVTIETDLGPLFSELATLRTRMRREVDLAQSSYVNHVIRVAEEALQRATSHVLHGNQVCTSLKLSASDVVAESPTLSSTSVEFMASTWLPCHTGGSQTGDGLMPGQTP